MVDCSNAPVWSAVREAVQDLSWDQTNRINRPVGTGYRTALWGICMALLLLGACHRKSPAPTSPPPPCADNDVRADPDECEDMK
jgi:hypothetical protein